MDRDPHGLRGPLQVVVEGLGYELVGLEQLGDHHRPLLRVYIDHPQGVTVDDCARVSHQVSAVLDVEDRVPGRYTLEVSSPGLDRPLFDAEQYARFVGRAARITLHAPVEGRRRFTVLLKAVEGDRVVVECDGVEMELAFDQIRKARLVPEI